MVGPVSAAERTAFTRKVRIGVTALVGASAALTALQVDASFAVTAGAFLVGAAVGWGLAWFVVPAGGSLAGRDREHARENPFEDSRDDDADSTEAAAPRRNS